MILATKPAHTAMNPKESPKLHSARGSFPPPPLFEDAFGA